MGSLTYTLPSYSSTTGKANTTQWFDLNTASDWLRSNGLPANATIDSAYITVYISTNANFKMTVEGSLYNAQNGSSTSGNVIDSSGTGGDLSNYMSFKSSDVKGHMNSANVGYFNSDKRWLRVYTSISTILNRERRTYYALTVNYTEHTHSYTSKVTKAATCTTAGETTYTCSSCGDSYVDKTKPAATGHSWNTETYSWSNDGKTCTATRTCKNDPNHKETAAATVTSEVKTAATCTSKGTTRYTAKFNVSWASTQTKDIQNIPESGHEWGDTTYSWFETLDYTRSGCEATRTCKNDPNHKETAAATVTSEVKIPGTCLEYGVATYTATFDVSWASTQVMDYQDVPCSGTISSGVRENVVGATCLTDGSYDVVYRCSQCGYERHRETFMVPALGHDMSAYTQIKAPNYAEAGEKRSDCSRCDHYDIQSIAALGYPILVNEVEQIKGVYYVESENALYYVVSGSYSPETPIILTVDDISFKVTNTVPPNGCIVTAIYRNKELL